MHWVWIDKFIEYEPGKRAVAIKNVSLAEDHLHDHFPGYPVMPGSLMIEAMAQTGGILVGAAKNFKEKVVLAKISKAVFHELVRPGDQLRLEAVVENITEEAAAIRGTITKGETLVGEISMMFSHVDQNMAGEEYPEENFVFNEKFMDILQIYTPDDIAASERARNKRS